MDDGVYTLSCVNPEGTQWTHRFNSGRFSQHFSLSLPDFAYHVTKEVRSVGLTDFNYWLSSFFEKGCLAIAPTAETSDSRGEISVMSSKKQLESLGNANPKPYDASPSCGHRRVCTSSVDVGNQEAQRRYNPSPRSPPVSHRTGSATRAPLRPLVVGTFPTLYRTPPFCM